MGEKYEQIGLRHRLKIKELLDLRYSVADIASIIGYCKSAIYREIQRGTIDDSLYDPYYAQSCHEKKIKQKKRKSKLLDEKIAKYISDLILKEQLSPERIIDRLAEKENEHGFEDIPKSPHTIYSAIDKGLIPGVTRKTLLQKCSVVFNNGLVCIPKWVRSELGIEDGDVLYFEISEKRELIYKKAAIQ